MKLLAFIILLSAMCSAPLYANINCYQYNNREVIKNCLQRQSQEYYRQSNYYNRRADNINNFHKGVGTTMKLIPVTRPYAPVWNTPRTINRGYQWYRYER